VVVTAAGHAAEKAKRCGAVAYLSKPFNIVDLAQTVLRHMERARRQAP
jgi:DNA-binding NtrC family response regulator